MPNKSNYYIHNVDYSPSGYDEYFEYDFLEKLGEVERGSIVTPKGDSKYWIAFEGRIGEYWTSQLAFKCSYSPEPLTMNSENHEYYTFSASQYGFQIPWGFDVNMGTIFPISTGSVQWGSDSLIGD
ncbi:hypothetical protein KAR48_17795 [bacterium]|nr:hypothetical protein [bacterium]